MLVMTSLVDSRWSSEVMKEGDKEEGKEGWEEGKGGWGGG